MPVDPSISLGIKTPPPPDVLGGISKAISLRDLMAQIQMRQVQTQDYQAQVNMRNLDLRDESKMRDLYHTDAYQKAVGSGDFGTLNGLLSQAGVQDKFRTNALNQAKSIQAGAMAMDDHRAKRWGEFTNAATGIISSIDPKGTDESDPQLIPRTKAAIDTLKTNFPEFGDKLPDVTTLSPSDLRAQIPTISAGLNIINSTLAQRTANKDAQAKADKAAVEADLAAKTEQSNITKASNEALVTGEEAAQKHAQTPVVQATAESTLANPKLLSPQQQQQAVESDRTAKETNRHNLVDESIAAKRQQLELAIKRGDTSYASATRELDNLGKPVQQLAPRLARIQDTLAQNTPAADALVAPELLTVMAGGQGSGLRVNEAEISRSLHGRSHWEDLKAAINKWQLDPKAALSITPEQRSEIRALTSLVSDKLYAKQKALDDAYTTVTGSQDVGVHRQAVLDARKKLESVDLPPHESSGSASGGYQVGHQYGNLVYKGGDPNSQASWGAVGH